MEYIVTSSVGPVAGANTGVTGMATMAAVPVATGSTAVSTLNPAVWYNYTPDNVGQIIANGAPAVQVELGNPDNIARQFNQQVQAQYGNLQLQVVQHPIIQSKEEPEFITSDIVATPKPNKARVKQGVNERIPCPQCGKTVSCNATLRDHMRTHTGERPFPCTECGLAFAQRSNLRMHKRLHTGERPYMCGICGKTFARSSHLPAHMRTHTGEKPYVCNECNHAFITAQQLKNHYRVHTGEKPWKCNECDAAFTHSSSLSTHRKKHAGEKPYRCEKCKKSFFFTSALDKHMKVHSKERPFKCVTCEKSFKYKESLTVHMDKYCGKELFKKTRAKRKPDARKPGPKPGGGKKYIKRKGKPRGRPRKRGRWSKRQIVKRNYRDMEEGPSIDFEELEKTEMPLIDTESDNNDLFEDEEEAKINLAESETMEGQENIPVAELKVEVLNTEDGIVLAEHIGVTGPSHTHHQLTPMHAESIISAPHTHEIRLDDAALTIVSAEEAEQVVAANGMQLFTLGPDMPFQLLQSNGDITHQLVTRDGISVWCPTRPY